MQKSDTATIGRVMGDLMSKWPGWVDRVGIPELAADGLLLYWQAQQRAAPGKLGAYFYTAMRQNLILGATKLPVLIDDVPGSLNLGREDEGLAEVDLWDQIAHVCRCLTTREEMVLIMKRQGYNHTEIASLVNSSRFPITGAVARATTKFDKHYAY